MVFVLALKSFFLINKAIISNAYIFIEACTQKSNYNMIKSDNCIISYITFYMIDLTQLKQFNIITYFKVDFSLIINYLIYLLFSINFFNKPILN